MQIVNAIPGIWVYTTLNSFNKSPEGVRAPYLSEDQQRRAERLRQACLFFDGRHKEYFIDEQRTQFDWPPLRALYRVVQPMIVVNLLRLISLKGADLLFGQSPLLRVEDPIQEQRLADLVRRSRFHEMVYSAAVNCSYQAETLIEAVVEDGEVYLRELAANEVFPAGKLGADGQYGRYDGFRLRNVGVANAPLWLLLTTTWLPGQILRTCRQLDDEGRAMREVSLDQWPLDPGESPLVPLTLTGIEENTITWIPNQLVRGQPVSDYDGLIELQDSLNSKETQIARVFAKHADPKVFFPARSADETGSQRASDDAYYGDSKEEKPEYIVWQSEIEAARQERDTVRDQILLMAEISPILLGIRAGGSHAEAFKTVRVQAYNATTKAQRKASYWRSGIERTLTVAQSLEQTIPGMRYDRGDIAVELRDGLPVDDHDQADRQSILRGAGLMSIRRALTEQLGDPAAVEDELQELEEENAAKTPSIFLGGPGEGGEGSQPEPGDLAAAEAATNPNAANEAQATQAALAANAQHAEVVT